MEASIKSANLQIFKAIQKLQGLSREQRKIVYEEMKQLNAKMDHFSN